MQARAKTGLNVRDKYIVIYHGGCIDGFTSAWVAWRFLISQGIDNAEYFPALFGGPEPDVEDKHVYILDFSYPRSTLTDMESKAKSLVLLDHHKSAEAELDGLPYVVFDMKRSGAGMAWDYFFFEDARVWLVDYVEDRDLWKWEKLNSKSINAWIGTAIQTFENWDELCAEGSKKAYARGTAVEAYIERYVTEMSAQKRLISFAGHDNIPIVNAPYLAISELVGSLAEDALFAMGWFQRGDGKYQYSLRSRGEFDVSALAQRFGGGGHAQSAGFVVDRLVHTDNALVV
jgi:oligoribonuclease NrnB/cAMP/cGMP phosphodiesterase (DHH superfamily)